MKNKVILFAFLLLPALLRAQSDQSAKDTGAAAWREKGVVAIREVPVWGQRPMKSIGVQETKFDSVVLKENIALSIADVLTFNSSIFVKQYGRATLSTVSFRGTGPSHTQVTWNGMRINNPMLGMTDFSMIPSYFIDDASLLHGTSSVNEAGGGLGGLVKLSTAPAAADGFGLQYIQGIGMYRTFDEFLRLTWGDERWQVSTRAVYQSSANDYKYRNRDKKENIYDEDMNIIGSYYPVERNKSGAFDDVHVLQEVYYNTGRGDRFGLNAWYINSNRELPLLTTDYADDMQVENRPAGTHPAQRPVVGPLPKRLENRGQSRVYPYLDGLRLPPGPGQRRHDLDDPFAEQRRYVLRAGRRGIFRRRQMALYSQCLPAPAFRKKHGQEYHPPGGRQRHRRLR